MKPWRVFILILASKPLFACGFYPYGEELRFSFFNPKIAGYKSFSEFYYSANAFEPNNAPQSKPKMSITFCSRFKCCFNTVVFELLRKIYPPTK